MSPCARLGLGSLAESEDDGPMRLSLYRRGNVWWVRGTKGNRKHRESTGCSDKRAADLWRRRREREFADPSHHASTQATVASAAVRFLTELKRSAKSDKTWSFYETKVRHVVRLLGPVRLSDLTHARVLEYITTREVKDEASPHSIHRELTALRRTLKSAGRAGEWSRDTKSVIPEYSSGYVPRKRWLPKEELEAVLAELPKDRAAAVAFIVATGCRLKEMRAAMASDIGETSVEIRGTKTAKSKREVPLVAVFEPLMVIVRKGIPKTGQLFDPWTNMRRDIAVACKHASAKREETIAPFTANDLRRTTATWLVRMRVPFEVVAKFLGHASTAMLYKVYGQRDAEELGKAIDERFLPAAEAPTAVP